MTKKPLLTLELGLMVLIFAVGLALRLAWLGGPPLSDYEAGWALQSLALARGEPLLVGPQPGYVLPTGALFFSLGSTAFLARLLPALAGAGLVLLPFLFRSALGRKTALLMALGLALDPGLVSLSRLAGGPMLAAGLGLLALGAVYQRRWIPAGVLAGLALLSGPFLLHGVVILGLAYLLGLALVKAGLLLPFWTADQASEDQTRAWRTGLAWLAGTVLLVGTLFGFAPQGLGAIFAAVPAYFSGWLQLSDLPALRLGWMLLLYQPLALVFGLIGTVRVWTSPDQEATALVRWLSLWFGVAFFTVLIYPSRQAGDLIWVLIPLWGMAAWEISRHLAASLSPQNRIISFSQALFLLVLLAFAWINLAALANIPGMPAEEQWRNAALLIAGAMVMSILTTLLVALGWSWVAARHGLVWGAVLGMSIFMLSGLWGSAYLRPNRAAEFWSPSPGIVQADLLFTTLEQLSIWETGHERQLEVVVLSEQPSLRWALRHWGGASFVGGLGAVERPAAIISPDNASGPNLAAAYRGQSFVWNEQPGWVGALPANWPRWLVSRQAPQEHTRLILWARTDVFPGGVVQADTTGLPVEPTDPGIPPQDLEVEPLREE
jgi:hypothetical protein